MSDNKSRLSGLSSLFVTRFAIALFLALSLLSNLFGKTLLSAFLMFTFLLTLSSRLWGFRAVKNVSVEIKGEHHFLFAGQSALIEYTVANHKLLPLIWLELLQDLPRNGCLVPDGSFELYEFTEREQVDDTKKVVFRKKLAFILSHRKVSWKSAYAARRRGIYQIRRVLLRSGDGFGFTQSEMAAEVLSCPTFVVYPKIVPVKTDSFFKNLWNCRSGSKGYFDDLTVLRGSRAYQSTDSWKHINWRMAARQPELQVKLFETIMPKSVHFIVDGESFIGLSENCDELEDALSVLASLILRLDESGLRCGISLPQTAVSPPVNIYPGEDETRLSDLLFQISAFDAPTASSLFDEREMLSLRDVMGQVYFITYDRGRTKCRSLLNGLDFYALTILSYREPDKGAADPGALSGYKTAHLLSLKKEGRK